MSRLPAKTLSRPSQTVATSARLLTALVAVASSLVLVPVTSTAAQTPPAISGVVSRDVNANAVLDVGELPLAGVEVVLLDTASGLVAAGPITTDVDGAYAFDTLVPGDYEVEISAPSNYLVSAASADNAFTPSGDQTTARTAPAPIGAADALVANGLVRPRPELDVGFFAVGSQDGTPPFDASLSCADPTDPQITGEDCGTDNGVVRNRDAVNISVSVSADNYEPGAPDLQAVIYEQTILPGPNASVGFRRIPAICLGVNPDSSIATNPDGSSVLTCNIGAISEGEAKTFTTSIVPDARSRNGSTFQVTQRVYSLDANGFENAVPASMAPAVPEYTVSAAPAYDLIQNRFHNSDVVTRTINGESLTGYITYTTFGIAAERVIGMEQLEQPFTFTESISATTSDGVTPLPNFEYYVTECRPNPTGWSETVLGRLSYQPRIDDDRKVTESGTCSYDRSDPADIDSPYELTLSGIDMSGERFPTRTVGGTDLSAGPFYVASYRLQLFIPFRTIDAEDGNPTDLNGAIQLTSEMSGFDPQSPSGTSNYGADVEPGHDGNLMADGSRSNNIVGPTTYRLQSRGSYAKYMRAGDNNINGTNNPLISGATSSHSGNAEVEPGQLFHGLVIFTNNGRVPLTNPEACDTFDNATMQLTTNDSAGGWAYVGRFTRFEGNQVTWPDQWIVEYATQPWLGDSALDGNGDGTPDFNSATDRYEGNWSAQATARCSDVPTDEWYPDPTAVPGGIDAVNTVRVRAVDPSVGLEPGYTIRFVVPLIARDTFFGGPNDGETIPTGTVLANFGAARSDSWANGWTTRRYEPSPENTRGDGDRVTLTRAQVRLQKHTLSPATAVNETGATLAGRQIIWELLPSTSAASAGNPVEGVVITDVLPSELTYNPDCTTAQVGGVAAHQVLLDTPSPDETTLIWNLGDVIANDPLAPIIYCTDSDPLAPSGTTVTNRAVMDSSNTVSPLSQRSDDHTVILEQTGSIQVVKTVDLTLDNLDDEQVHTIGFGNFSFNYEIEAPTIIDVFPYNGDGTAGNPNLRDPASDFSGTLTLTGPPAATWFDGSTPTAGDPFPELGTFLYSADTPNTITVDPDADLAANTTTWCAYDGTAFTFERGPGTGACPIDFADVTALTFTANYDLALDGDPRQGMLLTATLQAAGNEPGDRYTNRFGLDSASLPPSQFLRSNNVTVRVAAFSVGDFVFVDANADGAFDPATEFAAPDGIPVELRRPNGTLISSTNTSVLSGGRFLFAGEGNGDYIVTIPAAAFQAGGPLDGWVVSPVSGSENGDANETIDQHGVSAGSETVDGVTTGTLTLSAIPPGPGEVPIGEEPLGDNTAGIPDPTLDDFSNLTLDIGLVGPPAVSIVKEICSAGDTCDIAAAAGAGGWVQTTEIDFNDDATFRITVINTGHQTLSDLVVTDPTLTDCDRNGTNEAGLQELAPTRSVSWACTQTNITNGSLNTATVNGLGIFDDPVSDSDSAEIETPPADPVIRVIKRVDGENANTTPGIYVGVGDPIEFTYTVTNPGSVPLESLTLTDDAGTPLDTTDDITLTIAELVSGDTDGDDRVDPGETWEFGPVGATAIAGQYTNWATVTAEPTNGAPSVTDNDPANVFGSNGSVSIEKLVNGDEADNAPGLDVAAGAPVVWSYVVSNTGNVALTDVTVVDDNGTPANTADDITFTPADLISGDTDGDIELDIAETWRFELTGVAAVGAYVNVGSVSATIPGVSTPISANDPAHSFGVASEIVVEKTTNTVDADVAPGPVVPAGDPVGWSYTVTNPGNAALTGVSVVDDNGTPGDLTDDITLDTSDLIDGDDNANDALDPGETWTFGLSGTAANGQYRNLAVATGYAPPLTTSSGVLTPGLPITDEDPSHHFGAMPDVQLIKRVNSLDANTAPGTYIAVGSPVRWTFTVTNTGNIALSNIELLDDSGTPGDASDDIPLTTADLISGDTDGDDELDTDETWLFELDAVAAPGPFVNGATVSGNAPATTTTSGASVTGTSVSDSDVAHHLGAASDLAIVKQVNGDDANTAPGDFVPAGDSLTWTYLVTNVGTVSVGNIELTDDNGTPSDPTDDMVLTTVDLIAGDTDGDGRLGIDETWQFELSGTATSGSYVNTAVVVGSAPATVETDGTVTPGPTLTATDLAHHWGWSAGVQITTSVNGDDANTTPGLFVAVADGVSWTYEVTNTNDTWLVDVIVVDDQGVTLTCPATVLAPAGALDGSDSMVCTGSPRSASSGQATNVGSVTAAPAVPDPFVDPADFDPTDPAHLLAVTDPASGLVVERVSDTDPAHHYGSSPGISVTKDICTNESPFALPTSSDSSCDPADDGAWVDSTDIATGDAAHWRIIVTNTGNSPLAGVAVVDPLVAGCDRVIGDLAAGDAVAYLCTIEELPLLDEPFVNQATASGVDPTGVAVQADDTASVTSPGSYAITKRVLASGRTIRVGDVVEYELVVANHGMRTLNGLEVVDTPVPGLRILSDRLGGGVVSNGSITWTVDDLAPGAAVTLRYSLQVAQSGELRNGVVVDAANQLILGDEPFDNRADATINASDRPQPLAYSGSSTVMLLFFGAGLIGIGLIIVAPARRRTR